MLHLYPSQEPAFRALTNNTHHYALGLPTGMGKTVIMLALAAHYVARGMRVIITTPQEHIEDGFTKRPYTRIVTSRGTLDVGKNVIRAAREGRRIIETIREYLEAPEVPPYALACTHQALCYFRPPTGVPADMSNCVLLVDEAHRAAALGLSQFIAAAVTSGCRIIYASATLWRTDGEPVLLPGMRVFKVSLPRFMAEGGAPRVFRSGVNAIRLSAAVETEAFYGERDPSDVYQLRIVQRMVSRWVADGKPKTIVRVPPMRGGSRGMVARVCLAFERAGARTLDASGSEPADKERFHAAMIAERGLNNYGASQYDVVVGIQRVREGMDWKWCSTVYCVGLPKSTQFITQLMGRAARKKYATASYPVSHREIMQIEFFVPCSDTATFRGLPRYMGQSLLLVCAFLDNYEQNREWRVIQELKRGIAVPLSEALPEEDCGGTIERLHDAYVDDAHRATVTLALEQAQLGLTAIGQTTTAGNLYRWVVEHQPRVPHSVLKYVLGEIIMLDTNCSRSQAKQRLFAELNAQLAAGQPLHAALVHAFDRVLDMMEGQYVVAGQEIVSARLRRRLLELTGHDMEGLAVQLAAVRPLSPEWLSKVCAEHVLRTSAYPTGVSRARVEGWPNERWNNINQAICTGDRYWPLSHVQSLDAFCTLYVAHTTGAGGTMAQILELAARDEGLLETAASRRLLDSILNWRVVPAGDDTPIAVRDLPAFPASSAAYPSVSFILGAWLSQLRDVATDPVVLSQAWMLCAKLSDWLIQHRSDDAGVAGMNTSDCHAFTTRWRGLGLLFSVAAAQDRLRDLRPWLPHENDGVNPIRSGATVYAELRRCPFSSTTDGGVSIARDYANSMLGSRLLSAQTMPVDVFMVRANSVGPRRMAATSAHPGAGDIPGTFTRLPLQVPMDWFTHAARRDAGGGSDDYNEISSMETLRALPRTLVLE